MVIERDSNAGSKAGAKKIVEIHIRAATDISKIGSLRATLLPTGVTPISKRLFLDLLDPRWKFAGETFPEKIEGIAFGPKSSDGSRVLLITSDNDFLPAPDQSVLDEVEVLTTFGLFVTDWRRPTVSWPANRCVALELLMSNQGITPQFREDTHHAQQSDSSPS